MTNAHSQSTTSDGVWANGDGAIWSGGSTPALGGWPTININNVVTRASGWDVYGTFNVNSGSDLTITGNMTVTGGSTLTISGTLRVTGSITLNSNLIVNPGGILVVDTDVNVVNSNYLTVGTAVGSPPHADMIIKGNLNSTSSGDITVQQNGRLAVYGDVTSTTSGGTFIALSDGGQMYIGGDLIFPGGSDAVINNNTGGSIGLYIDGAVSVTGGGSSIGGAETTGGYASTVYLLNTEGGGDEDFYDFLETAESSPLPVLLISFEVKVENDKLLIHWVTATEIDNDFFTIEKSADGNNFVKVAEITGQGNTNDLTTYLWTGFLDNSPLTYYRLSQTDFDGTFEILGLKTVSKNNFESKVSFYPNQISIGGVVTFDSIIPEKVILYNQSGQTFLETPLTDFHLNLPGSIPEGLYFLKSFSNGVSFSQRLIIK